ncbi:hypothetical protein AB4Z35_30155, partial [Pseudomonas sp. KB_15]
MMRATILGMALAMLAGCATQPPSPAAIGATFPSRQYVLLGEVHDNGAAQAARLQALTRAVEAGWRPAVAMEQFDR